VKRWHGTHVHAYAWTQERRPFKVRRGSFPAHGASVRFRDPRGTNVWRHFRVRLAVFIPGDRGRGLIMAEIDSWRTVGGTSNTRRIGIKSFVRLKIGLGGRHDPTKETQ
jgi:hypothetical protein